jgi:hypothetical protein
MLDLKRNRLWASMLALTSAVAVAPAENRASAGQQNDYPQIGVDDDTAIHKKATLPVFVVTARRLELPRFQQGILDVLMKFSWDPSGFGWPFVSDSSVFTPERVPLFSERVPCSIAVLDSESLRDFPSVTLAGALSAAVDFSSSGRDSGFSTTRLAQGVMVRGMGPTLVLLDEVPINDPFTRSVVFAQAPLGGACAG